MSQPERPSVVVVPPAPAMAAQHVAQCHPDTRAALYRVLHVTYGYRYQDNPQAPGGVGVVQRGATGGSVT
jgi:hypothetical protein